ncbi:MAG: nodulation protein NfeD, partial [Chloroflexi bacterium]|nr:nodulation protein NfeD [Chloroflexota bacterium]
GLLTIAAAFALGFGGYIMFNTPEIDQYGSIPLVVIIGESIAFGTVGLGVLYLAMKTRYSKPVTGEEGMIGLIGEVRTALEPSGRVFVQGELWKAETVNGAYVNKGEKVMVAEVHDLLLRVLPADEDARLKGPPRKQ